MDQPESLEARVAETLSRASTAGADVRFSPAALEAMRLADIFSDVKPQEDRLPLDALAGFPVYSVKVQPKF